MSGDAAAHAAPLDGPQLWAQVGGDGDLLREVIQIFIEDLPRVATELEQAVDRGDAEGVFKAAHRIKGALLNLAASPSVQEARSLEVLGKSGDLRKARGHLEALKVELARLCSALEEISARGSTCH